MKLKFYLRGLGIGIVVTALVMGIATRDKVPLTDAEIKAAAAKLGMVESDSLRLTDLDQSGEGASSPKETAMPTPGSESGGEGMPTSSPGSESEGEGEPTSTPGSKSEGEGEPTSFPGSEPGGEGEPAPSSGSESGGEGTPVSDSGSSGSQASETFAATTEKITITIRRGTGSRAVCSMLADAGLVGDAAAFDQYLIDSGYSKRISAGTFEIPAGASEEEVAKIISRSK